MKSSRTPPHTCLAWPLIFRPGQGRVGKSRSLAWVEPWPQCTGEPFARWCQLPQPDRGAVPPRLRWKTEPPGRSRVLQPAWVEDGSKADTAEEAA